MTSAGRMEIRIEGLADTKRQFSALRDSAQRRILRTALRECARVVMREAKTRAPRDTGKLRRNIVDKVSVKPRRAYALVGFRREGKRGDPRNAFYGGFVELGTRFMPAQPFLRPAFEASRDRLVKVFEDVVQREIAKVVARARRVA